MWNSFLKFLPLDNRVNRYVQNRNKITGLNNQLSDLVSEYTERNTILGKSIEMNLDIKERVQARHEEFFKGYFPKVREIRKSLKRLKESQDILIQDPELIEKVKNIDINKQIDTLISSYLNNYIDENPFQITYKAITGREKTKFSDVLVMNQSGDLLILRRTKFQDEKMADIWGLPGGHVDLGEDFDTAAERELFEETGLRNCDLSILGKYKDKNVEINYYTCYLTEDCPTVILDNNEHYQYKFIPLNEIDEYPMPFNMADNIKEFLGINRKNEDILTIEKSKKAPIGSVVTHSDGIAYVKVKETGNSAEDWVPKDKAKMGSEKPENGKKSASEEIETKKYSAKELEKFAEETSEVDLQNAIKNSKDPKVREAANEELRRREVEEKGNKEEEKKEKNIKKSDDNTENFIVRKFKEICQ